MTDPTTPDGAPRKLMDVGRLARMGWCARIGLREGITGTCNRFCENRGSART